MKKMFAVSATLAAVLAALASPAFAKHRAPVAHDTVTPYGSSMPTQTEVVTGSGSHVIADPDPNIRTQLLRDPDPSGF
jgi:hypothetical protein